MRRWLGREAVWVAILVVASGWWGGRYVQHWREAGRAQIFYQQYFEPAITIACGRGFESAMAMPAPVEAFVSLQTDRLDCAQLPADPQLKPDDAVYQYAWFYLMWTVGLFWKVFGVSWSGLVPLFGALFALVIVLAYAIFRLAVPVWAALPAAAALAISTLHLQNLPHLRDYAKAPFVLALLLIMFIVAKRAVTGRRLVAWSALYGLVLGIGYGFRSDLLANILPFIVTVAIFTPGFNARDLFSKVGALVAAGVVFVTVAWPAISYVRDQGGCQWHAILLGLEYNFNDDLGVAPAHYQWITRYTDEYMLTAVNSFIVRTEGAQPVAFCTAAYDAASARYLAAIATTFPADVVTRAYASILRVTDLPFYLWSVPAEGHSRLGHLLTNVVGTSRLAVAVMVLALAGMSWRLGAFAAFAVLYVASYPMLQFAQRHFFHLEFLGWWAMAFAFYGAVRVLRWAASRGEAPWPQPLPLMARRAVVFGAVAAVIVLAPLPVARAFHDRSVGALTDTIMRAPRVPLPSEPGTTPSDIRLVTVPAGADPTQTVYLDVEVDLSACPQGVPLTLVYDKSNPFYDFSIAVQPQPRDAIVQRYLTPVFRGFQGLSLGTSPATCVRSIKQLASLSGIPLLPTYTLPVDWQDHALHQRVGWPALRLWRLGG